MRRTLTAIMAGALVATGLMGLSAQASASAPVVERVKSPAPLSVPVIPTPPKTGHKYTVTQVFGGAPLPRMTIGQKVSAAVQTRLAAARADSQQVATRGNTPNALPESDGLPQVPLGQSLPDSVVKKGAGFSPMDGAIGNPGAPQILARGYANCPFGTVYSLMARLKTCSGTIGWFTVVQDETGDFAGQSEGRVLYEQFTNPRAWGTTVHTYAQILWATGPISAGYRVSPTLYCHGCHLDGITPASSWVTAEGPAVGFTIRVAPNGPIPTGTQTGHNFTYYQSASNGPITVAGGTKTLSHTIRCQNAEVSAGTVGCNVNGVPGLVQYSRAAGSPNRGVALHIASAWAKWPTNWGDVNTGPPLHRTKSVLVQNANTNVKNVWCRKLGPRPAGNDCDEYPFASTREGGYYSSISPGGIHNQFSVQYVNASQNRSAGGSLVAVYNGQAISENEAFYVEVR